MTADERWAALVEKILAEGAATYGNESGPQQAFGSTSLKTNGKIFAMLVKDRLVVKLDRRRVDALVEAGEGERFDPGHGRLRRNGWIASPHPTTCGWTSRPRRRRSWPSAAVRPASDARLTARQAEPRVASPRAPGAGPASRRGRRPRSSGRSPRDEQLVHDHRRGADDARQRAERGALDRQVACRQWQGPAIDRLADRRHELVRAVGHAAADDDQRRIEEVHDARQHRADQPARRLQQRDRDRVTERRGPGDILRRQAAVQVQGRLQPGAPAVECRGLTGAPERATAGERLEAPDIAAPAQRPSDRP